MFLLFFHGSWGLQTVCLFAIILLISFMICFFGASLVLARRLRILSFCVTRLDCNVDCITDRVARCHRIRVDTKQVRPPKLPAPSKLPTCPFQLVVMSLGSDTRTAGRRVTEAEFAGAQRQRQRRTERTRTRQKERGAVVRCSVEISFPLRPSELFHMWHTGPSSSSW